MKYSFTFAATMGCALAAPLFSGTPTTSTTPAPTVALFLPGGHEFPPLAKMEKRGLDWIQSLKDKFGSGATTTASATLPSDAASIESIIAKFDSSSSGSAALPTESSAVEKWIDEIKGSHAASVAIPTEAASEESMIAKIEGSGTGSAASASIPTEFASLKSLVAEFKASHTGSASATIPTSLAELEKEPIVSAIVGIVDKFEATHTGSASIPSEAAAVESMIAKLDGSKTGSASVPTEFASLKSLIAKFKGSHTGTASASFPTSLAELEKEPVVSAIVSIIDKYEHKSTDAAALPTPTAVA